VTRFIHLTDLHICHPDAGAPEHKAKNPDTLRHVVEIIDTMAIQPDFVVASGDLTDLGDVQSYELFRDIVAPLKTPLIMALGNHDKRAGFHQVLGNSGSDAPFFHDAVYGGLHVITLDTSVPGHVAGAICDAQFEFLTHALGRFSDAPKLLVMHHPPRVNPDGLPWGSIDMKSTETLAKTLKGANIVAIMSGHIHINRVMHWNGIPIVVSGGLDTSVDLLETQDLRLIEGTSFGICDWQESGLGVSFVPLSPVAAEIGVIDRARLLAFT
jgi:3',5'-cyclic AMP phosphodiesterase CpdA